MKHTEKLFLGLLLLSCMSVAGAVEEKGVQSSSYSNKPITVVLREVERTMTLAPGERDFVGSACLKDREVVVGGGPTNIPASLTIVLSTLFFDGVSSGWTVDFRNDGTVSVTEIVAVSALCVRGRMQ